MFGKAVWAHTFSHGSWLPVEKSSTGYWFASHDLTYKALWFLSPWVPGVNIKILWGVPQDFLKLSPHIAHGTGESGLCGALNTLAPFKRTEWKSISCGQSSCTTLDTARKTWVTRLTRSMLGSQSDRRAVPEDLFFGPGCRSDIYISQKSMLDCFASGSWQDFRCAFGSIFTSTSSWIVLVLKFMRRWYNLGM